MENFCYGQTYSDCHDSAGYADGYPRSLSNRGTCSDPWKTGAYFGQDLYGSVHGGCDRDSRSFCGRRSDVIGTGWKRSNLSRRIGKTVGEIPL